jgi:predicted nucleotidyltransferase
VRLVTEVCVFGSFARGALAPHDLDIDVGYRSDDRRVEHFVSSFAYGRNP